MKRLALLTGAAIFAISGALVAQEPNTSAPGPTTNPQPNTANNDLANPGNPQNGAPVAQPGTTVTDPHPGNTAQDPTGGAQGSTYAQGTGTTGTTGTGSQGNGVTGGTTDTQQTTGTTHDTTGMAGTSVRTETTGTTTDTTRTTGTTGTTSGSSTDSGAGGTMGHTMSHSRHHHRRHHLPRTGSDMPLVGFAGLLALTSGLALRRRS